MTPLWFPWTLYDPLWLCCFYTIDRPVFNLLFMVISGNCSAWHARRIIEIPRAFSNTTSSVISSRNYTNVIFAARSFALHQNWQITSKNTHWIKQQLNVKHAQSSSTLILISDIISGTRMIYKANLFAQYVALLQEQMQGFNDIWYYILRKDPTHVDYVTWALKRRRACRRIKSRSTLKRESSNVGFVLRLLRVQAT